MGKRILTVDDSRTFRMILGMSLRQAGYEVVEVADGESALQAMKGEAVDMVITDLTMPGMDGIELTKKIRALPKGRAIPIILLSTEGQEDVKARGQQAGANGWIVKPFNHEELLGVVRQLIS